MKKIDFIKEKFTGAFTAVLDGITGAFEKVKDFFQGIVDWFKNSAVGKFFFGDDDKEEQDAIEGTGRNQSLEGEGAVDISNDAELSGRDSKDPIAPFYDNQSGEIIQPDNPNYFEIKKRNVNTSEQMLGDDGRIIPMVSEPKSLLAERQVTGNIMADGSDTSEALNPILKEIVSGIKKALENTPPELSADLVDMGLTMTGGGSLLKNIDKRFSKETGLPVNIADDPLSCVAIGTGKALDDQEIFSTVLSEY